MNFIATGVVTDEGEHAEKPEEKARIKLADLAAHSLHTDPAMLDKKRAVIEAALARARAKRDAAQARAANRLSRCTRFS